MNKKQAAATSKNELEYKKSLRSCIENGTLCFEYYRRHRQKKANKSKVVIDNIAYSMYN